MRGSVINLGCKVNRVESDTIIAEFLRQGWEFSNSDQADLVVINSCTVTAEAAKKTRKATRQALRNHPQAQIVVTGCASAIDKQQFLDLDERVLVLEKSEIAAYIAVQGGTSAVSESVPERLRVGQQFPTRVGLKVQDGCNNACTFCIVHVARGLPTSKPFGEVVREVIQYEERGAKEIVLTGINLGSYADSDKDIVDLLHELLELTSEVRFRLSSIEPHDISERLIALIADASGRVCRHLHVPLQSGSSKVLKEMARHYDADTYEKLIDRLYKAMPMLSLSTDVIVGFPGETEVDFEKTYEMVKQCRFSKVHIFPYSRREGTPAAERTDQVSAADKAVRVERLTALADELRAADYAFRQGASEKVVVEECGKAMTESYYHIEVPENIPVGSLVTFGKIEA